MSEVEKEQEFIFTFGSGHTHPATGQSMAGRFVRLRGTTETTRLAMRAAFGTSWSFQYKTEEEAGVARWGLREFQITDHDRDAAVLAVLEAAAKRAVEAFLRVAVYATGPGAVLCEFRASRRRDGTFHVDEIKIDG